MSATPAKPFSAGVGFVAYLMLCLHMNLLALTIGLLLEYVREIHWRNLILLLTAGTAAVVLRAVVVSKTSVLESTRVLGPLDRWVGIYWYAKATSATTWWWRAGGLLVGGVELISLALLASALISGLNWTTATPRDGSRSLIWGPIGPSRHSPAKETTSNLITLLRKDARLFLRSRQRVIGAAVLPLIILGILVLFGNDLVALSLEGDEFIRQFVAVLFSVVIALVTSLVVIAPMLGEDSGILGLIRSSTSMTEYLLSKLLLTVGVSLAPALGSALLGAYLIRPGWGFVAAVTSATVVVVSALSLLVQVIRMAMGANPRIPSTSSHIWLGVAAYAYVMTLLVLLFVWDQMVVIWVGIPVWVVLSGVALMAAGKILERMDLEE